MKKILMVYATREGQTEKITYHISERLRKNGAETEVLNARDIDQHQQLELASFDLLVFGASMHAGGIEKELLHFLKKQAATIAPMPRCLFLVLLSAALEDETERNTALADASHKLRKQLPLTFDHIEMIGGALMYSKYPLPLRWMMKRIALKAGQGTDTKKDYEYTDWAQVDAFADTLLEKSSASVALDEA